MTTPTNWSTNEIEKRYSPELLKAVDYLTVRYEPKPGDYLFMKLSELLGEDGTVGVYDTVKDHLEFAVSRAFHGTPNSLIKEDVLFIDLEVKRLQSLIQDGTAEQALLKPVTIGCALVVASGIGRAFGLDIADLLLLFATAGALVGGIASGQKWWDLRSKIKWCLSAIDRYKEAQDIYNKE